MQIIILGAGQVGSSLAAHLVTEQHSITVVDLNAERLSDLQSQYDLRTIQGYCTFPNMLAEAGADNADMIIAVTNDDETNMAACFVAATTFKIPVKMARIRTNEYFTDSGAFFAGERSPIDVFINPAKLITQAITHLIDYPGALRVFNFADEKLKLVATKPLSGGALVGKNPAYLREYLAGATAKIVAVYRDNQAMPLSTTTLETGDDVLFVAENDQVIPVINSLRPRTSSHKRKRIMIIGGGYIGGQLAQILENDHEVKLIEQNAQRCEQLARRLHHTLVLHGNGCDSHLLRSEDVENIDCFCALSNSDADNIVSSLHSKQLGAKQVIALVNRDAYLSLILSGYISVDIALSPQQLTVSGILKYFRQSNIVQIYSLRRGAAEAAEIVVHPNSKAVGLTVAQLSLAESIQIGALLRNQTIIIPDETTLIEPEDHIILFFSDKTRIDDVARLFADRG